jgi:hypothetical protein
MPRAPKVLGRVAQDRLAPDKEGLREVQQAVLRHFARTGTAPGELAVPGVDVRRALDRLHEGDYLRLGSDGQIVAAYPFSAVPTPHVVLLKNGVTTYAMCAIDALGIAPMLGEVVSIRSADPLTGAAVTIGAEAWDPASAVVLAAAAACDEFRPAMDVCCGTVNFFASRENAARWLRSHPDVTGEILDRDEAMRFGAEIFGGLLAGRDQPGRAG